MADNTDNNNNDELTPESLQRQLNEYQAALESEFAESQKEKSDNHGAEAITNTLEYFEKHVPLACAQIIWLSQHSTSDSTRLSANKYVIDRVFKGFVESSTDPVTAILNKLLKGESIESASLSPHED